MFSVRGLGRIVIQTPVYSKGLGQHLRLEYFVADALVTSINGGYTHAQPECQDGRCTTGRVPNTAPDQ